ncbi:hypothetical protein DFQ27_005811 [Actinomortierella ambigua]|uniref:NAD(P)-binding domain-containing protein n=1 Tax=Actinomortierella ambigua TaxID=1343610 RepID=A0A9P6Q135_9FUNG|nr:hypothetical protein DFQ27_005811 [Actinomortierella ambigua]
MHSRRQPQQPHTRPEAILVTGGAGFIGSHTVVQLLQQGLHLVIMDNLCNSSKESLYRAQALANHRGSLDFYQVDLLDVSGMSRVFDLYQFSACIHFAGLKAVGESSRIPLGYYNVNVTGTLNLIQLLQQHNCRNLIFSSSATVYAPQDTDEPINEDATLGAVNPYGRTKQYIEEILRDVAASEPGMWNTILLRYFNPVGAHESGMIGEDPNGVPNNLMPYVAQVAIGLRPVINVFGADYTTPDGTGVRDYIHVVDLASGHVAALNKIKDLPPGKVLGCVNYNLGSGIGFSVLDMIKTMSNAVGRPLPYQVVARRPGDLASVIADPTLAEQELGWRAKKGLQDMCNDLWRWQTQNPNGYPKADSPPTTPTAATSLMSLQSPSQLSISSSTAATMGSEDLSPSGSPTTPTTPLHPRHILSLNSNSTLTNSHHNKLGSSSIGDKLLASPLSLSPHSLASLSPESSPAATPSKPSPF